MNHCYGYRKDIDTELFMQCEDISIAIEMIKHILGGNGADIVVEIDIHYMSSEPLVGYNCYIDASRKRFNDDLQKNELLKFPLVRYKTRKEKIEDLL